jgi:N-acetylmuramoyl-L-alanine amidase
MMGNLALFPPTVSAFAESSTTIGFSVPEIKIFSVPHKDVIAIAVEERLPTDTITDPLAYTVEPQYRVKTSGTKLEVILSNTTADGSLTELMAHNKTTYVKSAHLHQFTVEEVGNQQLMISAVFPGAVNPQVSTVKRKRVSNPDNTTTFRTYVVISFCKPQAGTASKIIVLDPGHGGSDPGAVSNYLYEKNLNLDISLLARELFHKKGYDVFVTRADDSPLELLDRTDAANILGADVFISVHNNSMPEDMPEEAKKLYRGTTVLYNSAALCPAKDLAMIMCDEIAGALRTHKYPLQDRPRLVVLNATRVPAVIVEVAMLPHPQDAKMISQRIYRQRAAEAIVTATEKYFRLSVTVQ